MPDLSGLTDLPINALIFAIWWLSFRDQQSKWEKQFAQQNEFMNKVFNVLTSMIDTSIYQNGMLQKIYSAIEHNISCPYIREILESKHENASEM